MRGMVGSPRRVSVKKTVFGRFYGASREVAPRRINDAVDGASAWWSGTANAR